MERWRYTNFATSRTCKKQKGEGDDANQTLPANAPTTMANFKMRQATTRMSIMEGALAIEQGDSCLKRNPGVVLRTPIQRACKECPQAGFFTYNQGDPDPSEHMKFASPGFAETAALIPQELAHDFVDKNVEVYFVSDNPDEAQGTAMGIVLDHATGAFLSEVHQRAGGAGDTSIVPAFGNNLRPPSQIDDPPPPRKVAVSGYRQEVAVFGEKGLDGKPLGGVRVYDFDLKNEQLLPFIGKERIVNPVAVTYRSADDSYYVLDEEDFSGFHMMSLKRFERGLTTTRVATWPRVGAFATYGLTSSQDGSLVLSASNAKDHAIAVLVPGTRGVDVTYLSFGAGQIGVPAQSTYDGIDYALIGSDGGMTVQRETPVDNHQPHWPWHGPRSHGHHDIGECF